MSDAKLSAKVEKWRELLDNDKLSEQDECRLIDDLVDSSHVTRLWEELSDLESHASLNIEELRNRVSLAFSLMRLLTVSHLVVASFSVLILSVFGTALVPVVICSTAAASGSIAFSAYAWRFAEHRLQQAIDRTDLRRKEVIRQLVAVWSLSPGQ